MKIIIKLLVLNIKMTVALKNYPQFGIYTVKNNSGDMGAYDYNGNIVVPFNYQSVKALNATHYVVQQHNQYYLFDSQSQSVISQPYDSIVFNKELVIAEKNKKQSFFNHNCEPIQLSYNSNQALNIQLEDDETYYLSNKNGSNSIAILTTSDSGKRELQLFLASNKKNLGVVINILSFFYMQMLKTAIIAIRIIPPIVIVVATEVSLKK